MIEKVPAGVLSPTPETFQRMFGGRFPVRFDPLVVNSKGEEMSATVIYDLSLPVKPPKVVK